MSEHTRNERRRVLVTGANSGLGFEAAAQLAEAGWERVVLACRTLDKAEAARQRLVERVGYDPYELLAIDVSDIRRSHEAAEELLRRGGAFDALVLNAGMVPGDQLRHSVDGLEMSFAASLVGHHVLTLRLLEAGLLEGARVLIVGSEVANADMPAMLGMAPYDFAVASTRTDDVEQAMRTFATGAWPGRFDGTRTYATTKVFSAWWSAALARHAAGRLEAFTVSPGSNMSTNAARHVTGVQRILFTTVMPRIGRWIGWDQPVSEGAKRYLDVLHDRSGVYQSGRTYTSAPGKMVGPLHRADRAHLVDEARQDAAWNVLSDLCRQAPAWSEVA